MKIAVVGATGLVGSKMLQILEERNFPVDELLPVASQKSVGKEIEFKGKKIKVISAEDAIAAKPQLALFSAGGGTSLYLAPKFAAAGITVIDNSSAWRMDATKKLVVPEVTADVLTKEEIKMVNETKKIIGDDSIKVTATCVRIPVMGGHSESVNIEFENDFDINEVKEILSNSPGIIVQDDIDNFIYPMPLTAHEKDETFVGRIRRDETQPNTLNCWIVSDNLRKGAATNAVQIAEYCLNHDLLD